MRMTRRSTLAIGATVVISVGAVAALSVVSAAASTVPTPVSTKTVILTNSSNGSSVVASKGELIVVELSGGKLRWSTAQAIQSTPVLVLVSGSTSTTGSSTTVFRVANYGTAQINATGYPICAAGKVCPQFVVLWQATVVVPVVDPPHRA
jgi:hypothetical protein